MSDFLKNILVIAFKYDNVDDFLKDEHVIALKQEIANNSISNKDFIGFIQGVFYSSASRETDFISRNLLTSIFNQKPVLNIADYRSYLRFRAIPVWENYRNQHSDFFDNLSKRITDYLTCHSVDETIKAFSKYLNEIINVTQISYATICDLLNKYKNSYEVHDMVLLSEVSASIKTLIQSFNSKSKEKFVASYLESRVNEIRPYFIQKNHSESQQVQMSKKKYVDFILSDVVMRQNFRNILNEFYHDVIEKEDFDEIVKNIYSNNASANEWNLEFLGLNRKPAFEPYYDSSVAYTRATTNFLPLIKKSFDLSDINLINDYIKNIDNVSLKKEIKRKIKKSNIPLLEKFAVVLKEAKGELTILNGEFVIVSKTKVLSDSMKREAKEYRKTLKKYISFKNRALSVYYHQIDIMNKIVPSFQNNIVLDFTDDNYIFDIKKFNELFSVEFFIKLARCLDYENIGHSLGNSDNAAKLRKLLFTDHLLASVMFDGGDVTLIADIINSIDSINSGKLAKSFTINDLPKIVKMANIHKYNNDFMGSILSDEVVEKIINNNQFIQGPNTPEAIKDRLNKALALMIKAHDIDHSAIPYFKPVKYKNITLKRYLNDDPRILTSGIDSNTCFKINGNDNDYLFYSVASKNGLVIEILCDNIMCGRATAHLFCNVLMINGLRTSNNEYQSSTLDDSEKNRNMLRALEILAYKLIQDTSHSNCPIDYVICNKAGILESSEFDGAYELIDDQLLRRHIIDTYSDDYQDFINNFKQYLIQAPYADSYEDCPFTTDFGHFPVFLIASRDNRRLERLSDISYNTADAIYERPKINIVGKGQLVGEALRVVQRNDALDYYKKNGTSDGFKKKNHNYKYENYVIDDNKYFLYISPDLAPDVLWNDDYPESGFGKYLKK